MKTSKKMIAVFILPAVFAFCVMFAYPVVRTVIMSFFQVKNITQPVSEWLFIGFGNYSKVFNSNSFQLALGNMGRIWITGGVLSLGFGLIFAVILTSGVRGKKFFRAAIYLPNTISFVALATMWTQYVFNPKYGVLQRIFTQLGLTELANINWMGNEFKFWSMMIAFSFGSVGYYMLIFMSGIESIPGDLYEAATIDGAGKIKQFSTITMPLLRNVTKTNLTFWSINTIGFFGWSMVFSPVGAESSTITPAVYLMNLAFGLMEQTGPDSGAAAAVGVVLSIFVVTIFILLNKLIRNDDLEY